MRKLLLTLLLLVAGFSGFCGQALAQSLTPGCSLPVPSYKVVWTPGPHRQLSVGAGTISLSGTWGLLPLITAQSIYYMVDTGTASLSVEHYII